MPQFNPMQKKWKSCLMKSGQHLTFSEGLKSYFEIVDLALKNNEENVLVAELVDEHGNKTIIED